MIDTVPIKRRVETGELYVSDLVDTDVAFGNALVAIVDGLRESSNKKQHDSFARFTQKKPAEKVLVCNESDPKAFLNKLRAKFVGAEVERKNEMALPVVYFHRVQGLSMGMASDHVVIKNIGHIVSEETDEEVAVIDEVPVTATYQIYMLAWDQVSLNKLAAGIFCGMATHGRVHKFNTDLLSLTMPNSLTTAPAQDFMSSDISLPSAEDRLLAYDLSVEVQTKVYQARVVNTSIVTYSIEDGAVSFGELEL